MQSSTEWARQTFGDAVLGDARRVKRLVAVAAGACARPAGRITKVFRDTAEREGAFRLVENKSVDAGEIALASHRATARRCAKHSTVFVPVDQTSLSLADHAGTKFSRTGFRSTIQRGMFAMNALAVDAEGTTLGPVALEYWLRPEEKCPKWKHDKRPAHERESHLWRRAIEHTLQVMREHAPDCTPWFQLDRGADFGDVMQLAQQESLLLTVRAAHDRAIEERTTSPLWKRMKSQPVMGQMSVRVPARAGRPARIARLNVRAECWSFRVAQAGKQRRTVRVEMGAVYVTEPHKRDGIEWMLWTTHPLKSFDDAVEVVRGYAMRWRIEEFHRAWKSGRCNLESSQLRSVDAVQRWGAITAAVAARAEHLKLRSRAEPDAPATSELTQLEVDVAIVLSKTKKHKRGDQLTLHQAVHLIALVGGYTGKSSGGPPGTVTIGRGLEDVAVGVRLLAAQQSG